MSGIEGARRDAYGFLTSRGLQESLRPWERPVPTSSPGRRCACGTRLSIYNPDPHCATCETERWAEH